MGLVVTVQFVTTMAGIASPLAYGIAFLIVLMLGVCLIYRGIEISAGFWIGLMGRLRCPTSPALA